jgi:CspA family cold shock protein
MAHGVGDFFNDTGGYGFIETDESDEDVFFHIEDIGGPDIEEGQELEFDIVQADKGPRAEKSRGSESRGHRTSEVPPRQA